MTIPNLITMIRIILTPVFVIYIINGELISGLMVLIICGLSDGLDGMIARVFNQKSKLGAFLDPLADKMIIVSAFVTLSVKGLIPSWLTVVVISRDMMIFLGILAIFLNGIKLDIRPAMSSKITTCLHFITLIVVLSNEYIESFAAWRHYLYYLTALFTIISFLQYLYQWFNTMGEKPDEEAG